jgi:hypothetical protein
MAGRDCRVGLAASDAMQTLRLAWPCRNDRILEGNWIPTLIEHMFPSRPDGNWRRLSHTGAWRSLVAHSAGGRKVVGSNPTAPTRREPAYEAGFRHLGVCEPGAKRAPWYQPSALIWGLHSPQSGRVWLALDTFTPPRRSGAGRPVALFLSEAGAWRGSPAAERLFGSWSSGVDGATRGSHCFADRDATCHPGWEQRGESDGRSPCTA